MGFVFPFKHFLTELFANLLEANRKIFGSPLQQVLVVGNNQTVDIPIFCEQAISEIEKRGLDQEGIGRISGSAPKIEEYKNAIDDGNHFLNQPRNLE